MNLGGNFKQTGDAFRKIIAHMQAENICSYLPFPKGHNVFIEEGIMEDTETENITILGTFLYDFYSADPHKFNDVLKTIKTQCRGKILFHVEYANFVYFEITGLGISSYYIIIIIIIIIRHKVYIYIFILWLKFLPVQNGYCRSNKVGLHHVQQYMFHLYPQLLQQQGVHICNNMCTCRSGYNTRFTLYNLAGRCYAASV